MNMALFLILCCLYIIHNYLIAYVIDLKKDYKMWVIILGLVSYALLVVFCKDSSVETLTVVASFSSRCIVSFSPNSKFLDNLKRFLYLSVFFEASNGVINIVMDYLKVIRNDSVWGYLCGELYRVGLVVLVFCLIYFYRRRHDQGNRERQIIRTSNIQYWAAGFLLIVNFATSGLESLCVKVENDALTIVISLTVMFSYISIVILILIIIRTDKINKYLNDTINMEKKMSTMKSEYYEMMLQKEEDTRRYRHDMMNHYICLADLNKNSGNREVSEYLDSLMGKLKKIQDKSVTVGNQTIEILLNYYLSNLPEHVEKSIIGTAPEDLDISKPDLCTVFGNILSNASEELVKQERNKPWFKVEFKEGAMFFCIEVSNSIVEKKLIEDDISVSTEKQDIHNHGFGLRNTDEILRKIEGQLKLECDDEKFVAKIFIKKKK